MQKQCPNEVLIRKLGERFSRIILPLSQNKLPCPQGVCPFFTESQTPPPHGESESSDFSLIPEWRLSPVFLGNGSEVTWAMHCISTVGTPKYDPYIKVCTLVTSFVPWLENKALSMLAHLHFSSGICFFRWYTCLWILAFSYVFLCKTRKKQK